MKNLTLFLWIFTTAIATFFAYYTYTHTRIRHKDLESVMQQNLAVEKGTSAIRNSTQTLIKNCMSIIGRQNSIAREVKTVNKARTIAAYTTKTIATMNELFTTQKNSPIDTKIGIANENVALLMDYPSKYSKFILEKDTANLKISSQFQNQSWRIWNSYPCFIDLNKLVLQHSFSIKERIGVENFTSSIGSVCGRWAMIRVSTSAKSNAVKVGYIYETSLFLSESPLIIYPTMQVSEGVVIANDYVGEIEIKNVKAQNYNSEGKATKKLTGKITIKKADGSDTTFTLSTSYTVKKK